MQTRIGISGWTYSPWRGVFFPEKLPHYKELEFASRQFNTIEINGTFYRLQRPQSYEKWFRETPDDFVFAVKANRYITHIQRLKNVKVSVANFFSSGVLALENKLGPVLWQLPPSLKFEETILERFFKLLPKDFHSARKIAQKHNEVTEGRAYIPPSKVKNFEVRHAIEVRHISFDDPRFFRLLKKYKIAIVIADTAGKWPLFEKATSNFLYLRLHGDELLYVSGYTPFALKSWAKKIKKLRGKNKDVYVYFDNDVKVRAPFDALALTKLLKA